MNVLIYTYMSLCEYIENTHISHLEIVSLDFKISD